jgi:demethylmenaquinone methyltransferase/2-methoxy-6-polyprenyl-1,4-benzoquinol methylase
MSTTDFGFQQIPLEEKKAKVAEVFSSVATQYDIMNDLMSLGVHRWWKRFTIDSSRVREGQQILDVAGGTGDLTREFSKRVGDKGHVFLADINANMLKVGRDRLIDAGFLNNISYLQADAENLPLEENSFDCVTMAFGLRNVTQKENALASMYRVLKPGGQLLVLEFSTPVLPLLQKIYDSYSFHVIPWLGEFITGDRESYQYLIESIRRHPSQETLKSMMDAAGFDRSDYHNLSGGIVALHRGWKY